jgi:hypothetical protein
MVAVAGGGGGGIVTTFADIERAISQMGGDEWPRERAGIFDYIAVNRWNQDYKRETLKAAITTMAEYWQQPKAVQVAPHPDYRLLITFDNDEKRFFDVKPYLTTKPYDELKDHSLFNEAKISGTKIEWRPRLDIDLSVVYSESTPQ